MNHHLEALAAYGAAAVRIVDVDGGETSGMGSGGSLADGWERQGRGPLVGVVRDARVREVVLADGDLEVRMVRTADGARLSVAWGATHVAEECVALPPLRPAPSGPWFRPDPTSRVIDLEAALRIPSIPLYAVSEGKVRWYTRGAHGEGPGQQHLRGQVPPLWPEDLGSKAFLETHQVRWAYVAGAMAGGIASADLVLAMAREGLLAFFGAGGLPLDAVGAALERICKEAPENSRWGFNLLHNPNEPAVEDETVDLYLRHGVRRVCASAYMTLTPAVVRYRVHGIRQLPDGRVVAPNHVFAKLSRREVAERFLKPPPDDLLEPLVTRGDITREQLHWARKIPVAEDVTAEADSGGHTDRRPLSVLLPEIQRVRDRLASEYAVRPRVGAAGGLGTPASLWAAFAMGADYVLTGSVNQATVEAGTSREVKEMLAEAGASDVTTGPAPDMFELGANVQVLSRGTMYAQRARRLYEIYRAYESLHAIPTDERDKIEKQMFRRPLSDVWADTRAYWRQRDPVQLERAEREPRHAMALTFRWYLGMTSRWARMGQQDRRKDFQVWCGPAMGAFNEWARGTPLEPLEARTVFAVAEALMMGACGEARAALARTLVPPASRLL